MKEIIHSALLGGFGRIRPRIIRISAAGELLFAAVALCALWPTTAPAEERKTVTIQGTEPELWMIRELQANGFAGFRARDPKSSKIVLANFLEKLLSGKLQVLLPPVIKLYDITVEGDVFLDAQVIAQHIYIFGAEFKGLVELRHVTANGSLEVCNSSFESEVTFTECDLIGGVRFANDSFEGGFYAKDSSFRQYLRIIGRAQYPSKFIKLEDVLASTAIELRDVACDDIILTSVDCNSLAITEVTVFGALKASELTITKRLFVSDNELGVKGSPPIEPEREYALFFSDVFVGTTARLYRNRIEGNATFTNVVANSILAFDGSEFRSPLPSHFSLLNCNADCSFSDTTFSAGPELSSLSIAEQLVFRGATILGDHPLLIKQCNVNGVAVLDFKRVPSSISLEGSYFKALGLPDIPERRQTVYALGGMDFQRITAKGNDPLRWVRFLEASDFAEPFGSRLRTFLLDDGQKKAADGVRVELKRHQRKTMEKGTWPEFIDRVYDALLEYGTRPWRGLWIFPLCVFVFGMFVYRRKHMEYTGGTAELGSRKEPPYWSVIYTTQKLVPFFFLLELEGWKPRGYVGWFYLLLFPLAQLSLVVFLAHY